MAAWVSSNTASDDEVEACLLGLDPLIRGMIRKRMRVSLSAGDSSRENQNALEMHGDIWVELYRKFRSDPASIRNPGSYVSAIVRNRFYDYVRERYPNRHSLANHLRYLLEEKPDYAIWEKDSEWWCGFSRWSSQSMERARPEKLTALTHDPAVLGRGIHKSREGMKSGDWVRLLDAVFDYLQRPVEWDAFVGLIATLLGVVDFPPVEPPPTMAAPGLNPYERARIRQALARLWPEVVALNGRWRAAFLLNPPFGCDIDVFVEHGMTSIRAIGALFSFSEEQFELIWRELELPEALRAKARDLDSYDKRFCLLWCYLPIRDLLIGLLIERTTQQVIALRRLARERIAERVRGV